MVSYYGTDSDPEIEPFPTFSGSIPALTEENLAQHDSPRPVEPLTVAKLLGLPPVTVEAESSDSNNMAPIRGSYKPIDILPTIAEDPKPEKAKGLKKIKDSKKAKKAKTDKVKSVPLGAITHNFYHKMMFGNLRVPVKALKHKPKIITNAKNPNIFGYEAEPGQEATTIADLTPIPGGKVTSTHISPIEKTLWGPWKRVEATGNARDLVKNYRKAIKNLKKAQAMKKGKKSVEGGSGSGTEREKLVKPKKAKKEGVTAKGKEVAEVEEVTTEEDTTTSPANIDEQVAPGNPDARGLLKVPPPTPPESVFVASKSAAAKLSMPTLPNSLSRLSDSDLVEAYRAEYAKNPATFKKETREIKQSLVDAKVRRGGEARLKTNEKTVELANREDAVSTFLRVFS
jgi:hypothetical protein